MPDLRDYETEKMFNNHADCHSNIVLAPYGGYYFPCTIIARACQIKDGYLVYFFHHGEETEIPNTNIFGNWKALVGCEISFNYGGFNGKGTIHATDGLDQPMSFLVKYYTNKSEQSSWISLPFIYLDREQAKMLNGKEFVPPQKVRRIL